MDIPVPKRQRGGNAQFHLETPIQPCIWPLTEERHLEIFFRALILYLGLSTFLSPDKALPKYSDDRETTKNTDNVSIPTHKSTPSWPLRLAGCPVSLKQAAWLQRIAAKLHKSFMRLSEGNAKLVLFPVIQKENMSTTLTLIFQDYKGPHDFYLLQISV